MTAAVTALALLAATPALPAAGASAQQPSLEPDAAAPPAPLFASHDELAVTLTADFTQLEGDRRTSPDRPGTVSVAGPDGAPVEIGMEIRTRGEFRLDRSNCFFPPLRIDVDGSDAVGTVFDGQDDLKIVSSCRPGRARYDQLVPLEYLTYRALNEVTDRSFRVRAVRLTLVDTDPSGEPTTRFAFFIEDDEALAERFGATAFELDEGRALPVTAFDVRSLVTTGVFEYMIGNTDWSEVTGHNVAILDRGGVAVAVPLRVRFLGLVDAPYAAPTRDLGLDSVQERL